MTPQQLENAFMLWTLFGIIACSVGMAINSDNKRGKSGGNPWTYRQLLLFHTVTLPSSIIIFSLIGIYKSICWLWELLGERSEEE